MTLSEFLLARIAEDEAAALFEIGRRDVLLVGAFAPARVLADCAAKRTIVQREVDSQTGITFRRRLVLQDLATIYADHPDYRDEWRPHYADHADYRDEWRP